MNLSFCILVIDDQPDAISQALESLRDRLDEWGFELQIDTALPASTDKLRVEFADAGRQYDLVIVDYRLGLPTTDGAVVAQELRQSVLPYTEMVFYSSDSANLLNTLAGKGVDGVFVAARDSLDDKLRGVADIIIRKAVDPDHMRGIAMATVADLEERMKEALEGVAACRCAQCVAAVSRTIGRLGERHRGRVGTFQDLAKEGLTAVLEEAGMCDAAQKVFAIGRVIKGRSEQELQFEPQVRNELKAYECEVLRKRNLLAHAAGKPSGKLGTEAGMQEFRQTLRKHTRNVEVICRGIEQHVGRSTEGLKTPERES